MRYAIEIYTFCDGWVNNLQDEQGKPVTFATREEAQADLDDDFEEWERQIAAGERGEDEGYDRDDFRIVEIADEN